ncbi:MAG: hypothetical protein J6H18_00120, partial [Lachnospiraceae bacterium]|nr:hypothetical protein [Lachnospiraceae bacterium]
LSYMNGSRLLRQELKAKQQEEEVFLALTIGPDPREPKEISLEFRESGGAVFTASYRITSRDAQQYSGKLTLHSGASDLAYVNINWNKDSGAFTLLVELLESQNSFQLNGSLKKEGSITRFDLEKLAVSDASSTSNLPIRGIYLIWNEQAKFPLLNNYTEITSMNEEQISAVFDDVQKTFSELITTLLAAFGF